MADPRIFFDRSTWPEEYDALMRLEHPDLLVVGIDMDAPGAALGAIVNARRAGVPVGVFPVYREPLEALTLVIHANIAATADPDLQAQQLHAFHVGKLQLEGGKTPADAAPASPRAQNAAALAFGLADVVILACHAERRRWQPFGNSRLQHYAILPDLPAPGRADARVARVTIYAPAVPRANLLGFERALRVRGIEPQVIAQENAGEAIAGRAVVLPEWRRIMRARALAAAGYRVVVPEHDGSDEFSTGIFTYDPEHADTIADAALAALGAGEPQARATVSRADFIRSTSRLQPEPGDLGLVSIVVRTKDRPHLLPRAIASIARQSYPNIEIILVNNGGDDVIEIARSAAGGRPIQYVRLEHAVDVGAALNAGMRAASGTYVGYLDDDDIVYPDHCARAIDALQATGADFAYTNCIGEYTEVAGTAKRLLGMQVYAARPFRLDDLLAGNLATIHSIVHRRSLFERFGYVDESLPVTEDWELWLRMAAGGARFVHVDRATCEYSWRHDVVNPNTSINRLEQFAQAYVKITQRYAHLVAGRANTVQRAQAANLSVQQYRADVVAKDRSAALAIVMGDLLPSAVPVEGLE